MAEFTPGPWEASEHAVKDATRWTVAIANRTREDQEYRGQRVGGALPGQAANARLISSAPDLLAALEAALDVPFQYDHDALLVYVNREYFDEWTAVLRAALARAKGVGP